MSKLALIMLGGGLGAVCRYGTSLLAVKLCGPRFPWGTLLVNLAGCFLIGLVFGMAERTSWVTPSVRLFFVTGFLGALTTFSSFAIETVNTANAGSGHLAVMNVVFNNAGGLALALLGLWMAKFL